MKLIKHFLMVSLLSINISCESDATMILEYEDIQFFKANLSSSEPRLLIVEGLAFHSALSVGEIKTTKDADTVNVKIYLVSANAGSSGSFKYEVTLANDVKKVTLGEKKYVIWKKE